MGKRIRAQRKGSSPRYKVSSHRFPGKNFMPRENDVVGEVIELIHSPVHTAPLAKIKLPDGDSTSYDIESFNHGHATRKAKAMFEALGLGEDLRRAREGRKIRPGKGTMRGRVHKTPKSVLLVVSRKEGLAHAVRNLPGVDVVAVKDLCAEDLAPGGAVGRLTVFTKSAVEAMN